MSYTVLQIIVEQSEKKTYGSVGKAFNIDTFSEGRRAFIH